MWGGLARTARFSVDTSRSEQLCLGRCQHLRRARANTGKPGRVFTREGGLPRATNNGNLLTTERLFWHCGAHTAEPKLVPMGPIPPMPDYQFVFAVFCGTWCDGPQRLQPEARLPGCGLHAVAVEGP